MHTATHFHNDANRDWLPTLAINVVGALIIVALVVAESSRRTVVPVAAPQPRDTSSLNAARSATVAAEQDVHQLATQSKIVEQELAQRKEEREILATVLAAADKQIADRRAALDDRSRASYDLSRDLALAKADLQKLELERVQLDTTFPPSIKVESYPTPLAKPVDGKELHLQLRREHVTIVPVDELVERLKNTAREKAWKMSDANEMTDTIGPIDGFRMRYTLERVDLSMQHTMETGRHGSFIQLSKYELLPVASDLGEPINEALSTNSRLRAKLDTMNPQQWTVTLWVYPDSFDAFRKMRKEFYTLGYHVAGRPLPDDIPIGGSPKGSKSAAQ